MIARYVAIQAVSLYKSLENEALNEHLAHRDSCDLYPRLLRGTAKLHEFASSVAMLGCTTCRGIVINGSLLTSEVQNESFFRGVCDPAGTFAV